MDQNSSIFKNLLYKLFVVEDLAAYFSNTSKLIDYKILINRAYKNRRLGFRIKTHRFFKTCLSSKIWLRTFLQCIKTHRFFFCSLNRFVEHLIEFLKAFESHLLVSHP